MSKVSEKAEKLLNILAELYDEFEVRKLVLVDGVQLDLRDTGVNTWGNVGKVVIEFENSATRGPRWRVGNQDTLISQDRVLLTIGEYLANRR